MWEEYEEIDFECDDCGGPGPPPKFLIPPPPRPQFMQELIKCKDIHLNSDGGSNGGPNINGYSHSSSSSSSSSNSDNNNINNWESDMCEAIPILDASYHSSPTLQTSAMIAVFSLLLVLVVLISSLFVWKHKRKVQNFLPCKTPTRGGHIGAVVSGSGGGLGGGSGGHSVTYEDPDAHLGHRPLVMRHHHHNVEMLHHSKAIHYPSGYPMTRSPPLFVCSSPGPDPYRSNDNVYEELGPARDSDSEPAIQSDDDFAEDELSLPGERSFHKLSPPETHNNCTGTGSSNTLPVSTIYHERIANAATNLHEHNSLLTSSSTTTDLDRSRSTNNANTNTNKASSSSCSGGSGGGGGLLSGVFRHTTGRQKPVLPNTNSKFNSRNNKYYQQSTNHTNTLPYLNDNCSSKTVKLPNCNNGGITVKKQSDFVPAIVYDNNDVVGSTNNWTLTFNSNNNNNNNNNNSSNFTTNPNNCMINKTNNNRHYNSNINNSLENDVERRNRINNQLHQPPPSVTGAAGAGGGGGVLPPPVVSTIFRSNNSRYPQPYYTHYHGLLNGPPPPIHHHLQSRSRTNPRSLDRRRIIIPTSSNSPIIQCSATDDSSYGYAEPVFHEGILYNHHHQQQQHHHQGLPQSISNCSNITGTSSTTAAASINNTSALRQAYPSYIVHPDYITSPSYRTLGNNNHHHQHHQHQQPFYHYPTMYNHHSQDLLLNSPSQQQQQQPQSLSSQSQIYSRDSSFGSDSGYSHHTQGSSLTGPAGNNYNRTTTSSGSSSARTPTTPNSTQHQPLPPPSSSASLLSDTNNCSNSVKVNLSNNNVWNRQISSTEILPITTENNCSTNSSNNSSQSSNSSSSSSNSKSSGNRSQEDNNLLPATPQEQSVMQINCGHSTEIVINEQTDASSSANCLENSTNRIPETTKLLSNNSNKSCSINKFTTPSSATPPAAAAATLQTTKNNSNIHKNMKHHHNNHSLATNNSSSPIHNSSSHSISSKNSNKNSNSLLDVDSHHSTSNQT